MRKGKGILMTYLGLPALDSGLPVDANYHIYTKEGDAPQNFNFISFTDMVAFLKLPRREPKHLLLIDELQGWCDSYVSSSKSNRFASYFINQSAKLGYDMIFTTQRSMRADINYRQSIDQRFLADKVCLCSKSKCPNDCPNLDKCHFVYQPLDIEIEDQDVPIGKPFKMPFELAKSFWNRFDTYEAVPPIGLDEVLAEMHKYDPQRHNRQINELCRAVREAYAGKRWILDQKTVKDVLMELCLPTQDADVVFSRLRRQQLHIPPKQQVTNSLSRSLSSSPKSTPQVDIEVWQQFQKPTTAKPFAP